jgi:hypothetical protein
MGAKSSHPFFAITAFVAVVACCVFGERAQPASPTPVFAQAYGLQCSACHTQMPFLNSFGRYVQQSGYSALNPEALKHALPVFLLDARTGYGYQAGLPTKSYAVTAPGNTTDVYAVGALGPEFTYHVEQWLWYVGQAGFLDETWIAYHGIAKHSGHLYAGKLAALNIDENEAPFVLRDINDSSYTLPVASGVHDYALDETGARWGVRYNQFFGKFVGQVQYVGAPSGMSSFGRAYDFSTTNGGDHSLQWRAAYADPARPWEVGVFGESGTLGWTGTMIGTQTYRDDYTLVGPYVMKDPRPGSPGFRLQYAATSDSNPGYVTSASGSPIAAGRANGSYMVGSLYQLFVENRLMGNLTYFHTNMPYAPVGPPGAPITTGFIETSGPETAGSAGLSYEITPYVRVFAAGTTITHRKPYWDVLLWITPPLRDRR